MPNSHFVSRFLTKRWEFGQRRLWYYDFDRKWIAHESSEKLFARRRGSSRQMEQRLNGLVETPLSKAINSLTGDSRLGKNEVQDWLVVRALCVIFLLQAIRPSDQEPHRLELEKILRADDKTIDQLAATFYNTYAMVQLQAHPHAPLFYPSNGVFIVPVDVQRPSLHFILAIPLTPRDLVVSIPRDIDIPHALETLTAGKGGYLTNTSVGTAARRVVIHPDIVENYDQTEMAAAIEQNRARNSDNLHCMCAQEDLTVLRNSFFSLRNRRRGPRCV